MKQFFFFILICVMISNTSAQKFTEMDLWPQGAPSGNDLPATGTDNDYSYARLFIYLPSAQKNTKAAVIICPGGGYGGLAMDHEGHDYAKWLSDNGIAGIILKYRLPNKKHFIPLQDAQRAVSTVRSKAGEWNIDPGKIGISGFSAGGHLASTAGTHFNAGNPDASDPVEKISCRPDFMILFYPVITMKEEFTHLGSRRNLLGEGYNAELVRLYSNETQVTAQTPPTFLITSDDDRGVVPRNSIEFYSSLKKYNIPAVLYVIPDGGHGWGTNPSKTQYLEWSVPLKAWLDKVVLK
jgi:acetyl esterase/lipase